MTGTVRFTGRGQHSLENSGGTRFGSRSARVDDQVVLDALMGNGSLRLGLACHTIRPLRFP